MKGKVWSKPSGMDYKKYYCHKCGKRLVKEKTHRVVTQDDRDYYSYHDRGHFPKHDYDVYEYRFKCPSCEARFAYSDQRIIELVQKKCMRKRLSPAEIKRYYKECKEKVGKRILIEKIILSLISSILIMVLCFLLPSEDNNGSIIVVAVAIMAVVNVVRLIKKHNGELGDRAYSFEEISVIERLHTYSTHNKEAVEASKKCYCYHCLQTFESSEIKAFADDGQTAVCPNCLTDSIIPDSVDETIDENTLSMMHEYWF